MLKTTALSKIKKPKIASNIKHLIRTAPDSYNVKQLAELFNVSTASISRVRSGKDTKKNAIQD